jgi:predicted nucleic acid-binding protein
VSAIKRSFTDALEPVVYWDSSFAIARVDRADPWHNECMSFAANMQTEGVLCIVSELVYNELAFHIIKGHLVEEARRIGQYWIDVKRTRPDLVAAIMRQVESLWEEIERLTISLSVTENVRSLACRLMREYALLPTDAYHIAVALDAGVNAFVSLDEDFRTVDEIVVYTCVT